jgi:hypothetical protein
VGGGGGEDEGNFLSLKSFEEEGGLRNIFRFEFTCGRAGWKKRRRREVETKERTLALTWSVLEDPDKVSKKASGEVTSWKYFKTNGRTFGKICTILLKAEHTTP